MEQKNKTVNIAVIEDSDAELNHICAVLDAYGEEKGIDFCKKTFRRAIDFLETASSQYDIVFMDIQLPDLDGMSAARKLREADKSVILVFVTNFAQFAINGYEVDAADFIVKPVKYACFAAKMERILARLGAFMDIVIPVKTAEGTVSVVSSNLKYVEVLGHGLIWHTTHGNLNSYGSLYRAEERLKEAHFVRCNSCYLVNPRYVESVGNNITVVGGEELKISYSRKKDYRKAITEYFGGLV